ncbi:MAG: DUF4202 domain-containing protein [Sphingobacteriaceae bacterium]|nr:DUF4202 domain-containing protein [Sphingobacteriaceae bacterium]
MDTNKFEKAIKLFDNYNSNDPKQYTWQGATYPQELFFALKVYQWVITLEPTASEALLLASRCQHIGRWESPRESYPQGKAGYLNWRSNLAKYHAEKASLLLTEAGYSQVIIDQVQRIVLKQQLKTDSEVQTIENALCLVFLQFEYDDFITKHDDVKVIRILQKTWSKMTEPGRNAALTLTFSERGTELIKKALA